jgi:hypothetical protein
MSQEDACKVQEMRQALIQLQQKDMRCVRFRQVEEAQKLQVDA